jgi:hypothetical protein
LELTLVELKAMPTAKVIAKDHDGTTATYEGVPLYAILSRAGVPQGEALRGAALELVALVKAADGYKVTLSLANWIRSLQTNKCCWFTSGMASIWMRKQGRCGW